MSEKNPIDMIMDENDNDNIVLYTEDGEATEFEQIAVIPYEGAIYAILRPLDIPELPEDEAFVFVIDRDEEGESFDLVEDDETIDAVFAIYESLLDEEEDAE